MARLGEHAGSGEVRLPRKQSSQRGIQLCLGCGPGPALSVHVYSPVLASMTFFEARDDVLLVAVVMIGFAFWMPRPLFDLVQKSVYIIGGTP